MRINRLGFVILSLGVLGSPLSSDAASIHEKTNYFTLRGSTLEQLDRELNRKGPLAGSAGDRHPGATQVKFGGTVSYQQRGPECRISKVDFNLKLVKILPRWTPPKSASAATVIVWRTLAEDIARHEEDHAKIARDYLRRMEAAVRNLAPRGDCDTMEKAVNAVTARYLKEHERAQMQFDVIEGRDVNYRLKKLLRRNLEEARNAETSATE